MKNIRIFLIIWSLLLLGTNFMNAQAYHESFENFNCEYDCNSTCHNYFYDECIPNWYSANEQPRILKNECNTVSGISASDGEYFAGFNSVGHNFYFELPNDEIFQYGNDYLLSFDGKSLSNGHLFIEGYNDLQNINENSWTGNGDYIQGIVVGDQLYNDDDNVWTSRSLCFTVNNYANEDFNQLLFKVDFLVGGGNNYPTDCPDPFIVLDNIRIICQQNYDIDEIDNTLDYENCSKSRTFELVPLGNCTNDLTNFDYTVELYKEGDLVNSFINTGNTFTFNFDLFDKSTYVIKVEGLNSEDCGYVVPTLSFDLEDDFPVDWEIADITTWDSPQIINHDIYIVDGGFLTITAKTTFSPETRLIVERGGKLVVDAATLTSICGDWEGIVVEGNSNEEQPNYDEMPNANQAGIVVTKNYATIENAHIGISTNYVGQWSDQYWGGVVHCEYTEFKDCWKGVEFMKYDYENKGYFNHCTFTGEKHGVTIWACHGITFNHCTFDGNWYCGIGTIDADFLVEFDNTFMNCHYGIEASGTSADLPDVEVMHNNNFYDNDYALDFSGVDSRIESNYFEGNTYPVWLDGDNKDFVEENSFGLNTVNVISYATGYNQNWINCNDMYSQYGGIWMGYDNQLTTFLSNNFTGTTSYGYDYYGWNADIVDEVGNAEDISAWNVFSGVERDIDSREENGNEYFEYFVPPDASPDLIPDYPGNYSVRYDGSPNGLSCSTIEPPTVTKTEISILITDYCYWWREYRKKPSNWYVKWKFHQIERKFHYKYYWWYRQRYKEKSWEEIEEILKELCSDRWKVRLYGFYMRTGQYTKAEATLNELDDPERSEVPIVPEDLSDESRASFIAVQRINLKYQKSNGAYQPTESELNTLRAEVVKDIPERAYARGLLLLTTGEKYPREITEGLEQREAKSKLSDQWSIYPNPAKDILYIDNNVDFDGKIAIYNLMGSKMLQMDVISKGSNKIKMDVSSLKDGVYMLIVRDKDNNLIKTEKVIINSVK